MEKRLFLAIGASLLILLIWNTLVVKPQVYENKEVTLERTNTITTPSDFSPSLPSEPAAKELLFDYDWEGSSIVFDESRAQIKKITFPEYQNYTYPLLNGLFLLSDDLVFKRINGSFNKVQFEHVDNNKRIIKSFIFNKFRYSMGLEIEIENLSPFSLTLNLPLVLGSLDFSTQTMNSRYQDVTVGLEDRLVHLNGRKETSYENMKFLSIRDRYFCAIIQGEGPQSKLRAFVNKIKDKHVSIGVLPSEINIKPNKKALLKFDIYLGPQDLRFIQQINPEWSGIMYFGTFDIISNVILQLLNLIYRFVQNWGLAIVIISALIYLLLSPLLMKQMKSMKEMQALQPHIEEVRKLYKDNPQKQQKEIMELYKAHKINPLGGCLPFVFQIPVFFALYQVLMRSIVLKGADFLWIKDLAEPDRLFVLSKPLPIIGDEINLLPILMAIGMFVQQKFSTMNTSKQYAEQQKMMTVIFPVVFAFLFYKMPSGLVLYWFINSTLMLLYQISISKAK